ncbi:MAG: ribosome maturation factor RimP [Bryobacterales bacterium]|nr:ribosome maturation factor RimP [Bryobacterales bacterium]
MSQASVVAQIEAIAERVGHSEGVEIVAVELKGGGQSRFLRISIDKPEGVTHADCERISHEVGTILDVEDLVPGHYTLEVSSPGVERPISKPADFERFRGKKAHIVLREPVGDRKVWDGTLGGLADGCVVLEVIEQGKPLKGRTPPPPKSGGTTIRLPIEQVERANLKFEW